MSYVIRAIPPEHLERIRRRGADDYDNELRPQTSESAGAPLRCCLREADAGEAIALIAYRPFAKAGPYSEVGPIFVHAARCEGRPDARSYPEAFRRRRQVLRAYDDRGAILDAVMTEGAHAELAIAALFARPETLFVHSRNVLFGCFMFAIERA